VFELKISPKFLNLKIQSSWFSISHYISQF